MDYKNLMTVGDLASKMNVTVRTIQYYDKQNLLKPSAISDGGRRLYTNKDMVKLGQILSLKFLGFSLCDIKNRLIPINTPEEVDTALKDQSNVIKEKILHLKEILTAIDALRDEIQQINSVDWKKYSDIISLLRLKDENYWLIKYFDSNSFDKIRTSLSNEESEEIISTREKLYNAIILLQSKGELPTGTKAQIIAKSWWDMVAKFTDGNINMLKDLIKFNNDKDNWHDDWKEKQATIDDFLGQAMMEYFKNNNIQFPNIK